MPEGIGGLKLLGTNQTFSGRSEASGVKRDLPSEVFRSV
jgi:hypothetical protein